MVINHWPEHGAEPLRPPRPDGPAAGHFYNVAFGNGLPGRTFQRPATVDGYGFTLRVFRDESGIRETMREILISLVLGLPIAVLLSAQGGYLMAGRALKPLREMTEQTRESPRNPSPADCPIPTHTTNWANSPPFSTTP